MNESQKKVLADERAKNVSKKKISSPALEEEKEKPKRTNSAKGPKEKKEKKNKEGGKEKDKGDKDRTDSKDKEKKSLGALGKSPSVPKGEKKKPRSGVELSQTVHDAARMGDRHTLKKLVKKDGKKNTLDVKADAYGQTALHIACEEGHLELVEMMITKYGCAINNRDNSGWTPLFCACSKGQLKICELLLAEGAQASIKSNDQANVLHYFVRNKLEDTALATKVMRGLLENGADIDCQNINGETALHIAAARGTTLCVEFLLQNGASPNLKDKEGETPLHHAVRTEGGNKEIVTLLLDYGADKSIAGENGTPIDVAESKGLTEIAEVLRTYVPVSKTTDRTPRRPAPTSDKSIKIVVVGDPKCSCKTQVITCYLKSNPKMRMIEGTTDEGTEKPMHIEGEVTIDNKQVHVTIVDGPTSQEAKQQAYAQADLFLVLFSIIDPDSLRSVLKTGIPEILNACPGVPYFLVGTNSYLRDDSTTTKALKLKNLEPIPIQQGNDIAKKIKALKYLECSTHMLHQGSVVALFKDEAFRVLVSPSTKENKELAKQNRLLEKIKAEALACRAEARTEFILRKRGLDNTHIPGTLGDLKELRKLNLSDNKLFFVPLCLLELPNLEVLELRNNAISFLPKSLPALTSLKKLDVENNALRSLPGEMGTMTHLTDLKLRGNPQLLDSWLPPEAQANGTRSILAYLRDLHKGAERCYRMKLMFVGKENAGKTSLSYYLQNNKKMDKAPLSTDGIDINNWEIPFSSMSAELSDKYMQDNWSNKPITFAVWDFAGQEVYYSTHQFYLSRRSMYIVVFALNDPDIAAGNFSRVLYWLQSVNAQAKGAPIIIVGTRLDLCPVSHAREVFLHMKEAFSQFGVKHFVPVSCLNGRGLPELKNLLIEVALKQRNMGEQIPKSYLDLEQLVIKKREEILAEKKPPTTRFEQFRKMAMEAVPRLDEEEVVVRAMQFLHELGSIVYFNEAKSGLADIVILDPHWLTEVMATVVSSKTALDKGIMHHKFLTSHIWKGEQYPPQLHDSLLRLLEKFYITFRLRRKRPVLRALLDVTGPTPNQLSFTKGDKILLLEKSKVGKWWKGYHNGQVGYFNNTQIRETEEPPEYTFEGESLVPCLLPEEPPSNLRSSWPEFPATDEQEVGRRWWFDFLPIPFFSQLMVRMLHFAESKLHWRYGIILEKGPAACFIEVNHGAGHLDVTCRGRSQTLLEIISLVEEEVDTIRDWFGVKFTRVTVPCSHCVREHLAEPYAFNVEDCESAVAQDLKTMTCENRKVLVPLSELVPDIAMSQYAKMSYAEIEFGKVLGEGAYADVYKAVYKGDELAVKRLKNTKGFKEFRTEVKFMSVMEHPNIVLLKGVCLNPPCICTEFMDCGDLHSFLDDGRNTIPWQQCILIAKDIAQGMQFLHGQIPPKIHRDLKSPNILLARKGDHLIAKVADFGTSRSLAPTIGGRNVDNPIWLAPEVMRSEEYTEKADVYSYGIILWEIFTRQLPFGKKTRFQVELGVVEGERPEMPHDWPPLWKSLTTECWDDDASRRPPFIEVLQRLQAPGLVKPETFRAVEDYANEAVQVKVSKGDLVFPVSSSDPSKRTALHRNKEIVLPVSYIEKECEGIDFADYYASTHKGRAERAEKEKKELELVKEKERREIEKRVREKERENEWLREQERDMQERERDLDREKEKEDDDARISDLIFTPRRPSPTSAAPVEAQDPSDLRNGFHRVLDETSGRLPHMAGCLDNSPSLLNGWETLLSVDLLCIERSSMQHMRRNEADLTSCVMEIVPERGKMHNPATNTGGLLLGRVTQVGASVKEELLAAGVKEGTMVIPSCSLCSIPLRVAGVGETAGDQLLHVEGVAIVFAAHPLIPVPSDLSPEMALLAADISSALRQLPRFLEPKSQDVVLIIGCGRIGLTAMCYVRKLAPAATILCVDVSEARIEVAASLGKADKVEKVNVRNSQEMSAFVRKHTKGGLGADLVLNCVAASETEGSSLLAARPQGTVLFCCNASTRIDNIATCPNDVCVVLNPGGTQPAQVQSIFGLLKAEKQLQTLLSAFLKKN